jgi:replicative DNA helicase
LQRYEETVEEDLASSLQTMTTYYRGDSFTPDMLEKMFRAIQDQTDLIILDHLHYIDEDNESNENLGMKRLVKRIRDIALSIGVPVICIAHLRKMTSDERMGPPSLEQFHGSSDITKIATQVITLAPAPRTEDAKPHLWSTYVHIAKDRRGSGGPWCALMRFNLTTTDYEPEYWLGYPRGTDFRQLDEAAKPGWYGQSQRLGYVSNARFVQ